MSEISPADGVDALETDRRRGPDGLKAVERAVLILNTLAEVPGGMSLADLSRATEIRMTTAHRLVSTLRHSGLIRETPDGLQTLGVNTLRLASTFLDGLDVRAEARAHLLTLRDELNETCHLGTLSSPNIVYIDKLDSKQKVRMYSTVGGSSPAVHTAIGKAILAHSPAEIVADVLRHSAAVLDIHLPPAEFEAELEHVRQTGFATDLDDTEQGISCVAAPIFDHLGRITAAVSVSTPSSRFKLQDLDRTGARIRATADDISAALGNREGASGAI